MKPLLAALLALCPLIAQDWDTSGNGQLNGSYNFRQVIWRVSDSSGNLNRAVAITGTIEFDGAGAYRLRAGVIDSTAPASEQSLNMDGRYAIAASGHGFLTNPALDSGRIYGSVSQGIFVGSSTEEDFNDLFIAAPAVPDATTANFNGRYWIAELNLPNFNVAEARDVLFQANADGQGGLGNIAASGFIGNGRQTNQTVSGVRYTVANGAANVSFGGTLTQQNLLAGSRKLFFTSGGNFVFGGSTTGWEMTIGVRTLDGAPPTNLINGLYLTAGVDVDTGRLSEGRAITNSYYGAFTIQDGDLRAHQRLLTQFQDPASSYDFMYSDLADLQADGTYEDYLGQRHIVGADGTIIIGFGLQNVPGISVALRAPKYLGDGVYLSPAGIVNAASFAPFTSGVASGELVQLSGTSLAAGAAEDAAFPNTLGGVQVQVNGRLAPIRSVSPEKIVALVPTDVNEPILRFSVLREGAESNSVTAFRNATAPGAFTVPPGGAGYVDAIHSDGSAVTKDNPARTGESITVRVTGLGVMDSSDRAVEDIAVFVDGEKAAVSFAGLAPGIVGLNLVTFTVPTSLDPGDLFVDVSGPDAYSTQAQMPVVRGLRDGEVNPLRHGRSSRAPGRHGRPSIEFRNRTGLTRAR